MRTPTTKILLIKLLTPLALVGMVAWFCDGMLVDNKIPLFRDLGTYFYPIKFSLAKSFHAGGLGLWERHMAAGFPLFAAFQPGAFYPPSLVFYVLPFFEAVRWTFFIHFLIAASGAYFLCRHWQYPINLSLIGAVIFAFGGTTVSLSNLLNHFQGAVWLPWVILCGERYFVATSWKTFVLMVLVLLCSLLAGSPEIYLFSMGLLLIDGVRIGVGHGMRKIARTLLLILTANFVVAALGMVQFLPTLELLMQSRRDRPIPFHEASYWSLNPISLMGVILPDKEVDYSLPLGVRLFFVRDVPFLLSHYLGVLSILGISAWANFASWKERFTLLALLLASVTLALGSFTPVYSFLFEHIPLFRIVRFPEKFFFISYALLFYTVVKGLVALQQRGESQGKCPILVLLFILTGWVVAYCFCRLQPEMLPRLINYLTSGEAVTATTVASVLFGLERQIGITIALVLIYFCTWRNLLGVRIQRAFVILIVLFDLGTAHKPLLFLLDTEIVTKNQQVLSADSSEGSRIFYYTGGRNLHPSSVTVLGRPSFSKGVALSFENLLPNAGILYGFDYFQEIDALTRQPYNDFLDFANLLPIEKRANFLRALNIRYIVAFQVLNIPGMRLVKSFPEHFSWLYEIVDSLPRVYIASQAVYEPQRARTLRILASREFDPRTQVLVNEELATDVKRAGGGEAQIVKYFNNRVVIDASLAESGVLVLTDSYYPGWKVLVNGKEERILRANHFFRGVQLPAGKHHIEFKYQPLSFTIGSVISLFTLVLLGGISLVQVAVSRIQRHQVTRPSVARAPTAAER